MPLRVHCPTGHVLMVPDERAGKAVKCPRCQQVVMVPATAARFDGESKPKSQERPEPTTPQKPKVPTAPTPPPPPVAPAAAVPPSNPPVAASMVSKTATENTATVSKPGPKKPASRPTEIEKNKQPPTLQPLKPTGAQAFPQPKLPSVAPVNKKPPSAAVKQRQVAEANPAAAVITAPPDQLPATIPSSRTRENAAVIIPPPVTGIPNAAVDSAPPPIPPPVVLPPAPPPKITSSPPATVSEEEPPVISLPAPPPIEGTPTPAPLPPVAATAIATPPPPPVAATVESEPPVEITPSEAQVSGAYLLGGAIVAVAVFSVGPACWEMWDYLQAPDVPVDTWVLVVLALGLVQLAYAVYMVQLPDWTSAWVVSLMSLLLAGSYGVLLGIVVMSAQGSAIIQTLQLDHEIANQKVALWSIAMISTTSLLSWYAGHCSNVWHRAESVLRRAGLVLQ